jgi:hypothetical protein
VGFQVLTAASMKFRVFWDVAPCSHIEVDRRFRGASIIRGIDLTDSDGFLRAIKIRSTTSFGGEVKPSSPCRKMLRHVKDHFIYDRDTDWQI